MSLASVYTSNKENQEKQSVSITTDRQSSFVSNSQEGSKNLYSRIIPKFDSDPYGISNLYFYLADTIYIMQNQGRESIENEYSLKWNSWSRIQIIKTIVLIESLLQNLKEKSMLQIAEEKSSEIITELNLINEFRAFLRLTKKDIYRNSTNHNIEKMLNSLVKEHSNIFIQILNLANDNEDINRSILLAIVGNLIHHIFEIFTLPIPIIEALKPDQSNVKNSSNIYEKDGVLTTDAIETMKKNMRFSLIELINNFYFEINEMINNSISEDRKDAEGRNSFAQNIFYIINAAGEATFASWLEHNFTDKNLRKNKLNLDIDNNQPWLNLWNRSKDLFIYQSKLSLTDSEESRIRHAVDWSVDNSTILSKSREKNEIDSEANEIIVKTEIDSDDNTSLDGSDVFDLSEDNTVTPMDIQEDNKLEDFNEQNDDIKEDLKQTNKQKNIDMKVETRVNETQVQTEFSSSRTQENSSYNDTVAGNAANKGNATPATDLLIIETNLIDNSKTAQSITKIPNTEEIIVTNQRLKLKSKKTMNSEDRTKNQKQNSKLFADLKKSKHAKLKKHIKNLTKKREGFVDIQRISSDDESGSIDEFDTRHARNDNRTQDNNLEADDEDDSIIVLRISEDGYAQSNKANSSNIRYDNNRFNPLTPYTMHMNSIHSYDNTHQFVTQKMDNLSKLFKHTDKPKSSSNSLKIFSPFTDVIQQIIERARNRDARKINDIEWRRMHLGNKKRIEHLKLEEEKQIVQSSRSRTKWIRENIYKFIFALLLSTTLFALGLRLFILLIA